MGKYEDASARSKKGVSSSYADDNVYVKNSDFLEGLGFEGNGLYAARTFNLGDVILEYRGIIISDAKAEKKKTHRNYMFDVKLKGRVLHVIDGANNKHASAAKFVNSVLKYSDRKRNSKFVQYDQKIFLVATKKIYANREIISFYGEDTHRVITQK